MADEHSGRSLDLLWSDTSLTAQLLAAVPPRFAAGSGVPIGSGRNQCRDAVVTHADVDLASVSMIRCKYCNRKISGLESKRGCCIRSLPAKQPSTGGNGERPRIYHTGASGRAEHLPSITYIVATITARVDAARKWMIAGALSWMARLPRTHCQPTLSH